MTAVCGTGVCVLTCWGSELAPAPPLRWHQGWFEPQCRCRGWCNTLPAPLTWQKKNPQTKWVTIREERRGVIKSREFTNLSDHPLEDVAAADSLENLRWDSLRDAVQTFLHEGFTLESNTHKHTGETDRQTGVWSDKQTDYQTHLRVECGSSVEEEFADFMHPVSVASRVFQTGEEPAAHGNSFVQTSGHISCKQTHI